MNRQREEKVNRKMKEKYNPKMKEKTKSRTNPRSQPRTDEFVSLMENVELAFRLITGQPKETPKLPDYILEKAEELGSRISYHAIWRDEDRAANWYPSDNHISLPLKGSIRYLEVLALHELGHAATTPKTRLGPWFEPPHVIIRDEAQAWKWARDNAPVWTPAMERYSRLCLRTYTKHFGCADLIEEIYPRGVKS